eukprot:6918962-Alexandrium_andersonii.AAC.1
MKAAAAESAATKSSAERPATGRSPAAARHTGHLPCLPQKQAEVPAQVGRQVGRDLEVASELPAMP